MPIICLNMTAMEEAPSWFGLVSAEMEEHNQRIVIKGMMTGLC